MNGDEDGLSITMLNYQWTWRSVFIIKDNKNKCLYGFDVALDTRIVTVEMGNSIEFDTVIWIFVYNILTSDFISNSVMIKIRW